MTNNTSNVQTHRYERVAFFRKMSASLGILRSVGVGAPTFNRIAGRGGRAARIEALASLSINVVTLLAMHFLRRPLLAVLSLSVSIVAPLIAAPVLPEVHTAVDAQIAAHEIAGAVTVVLSPTSTLHLDAQGFADLEKKTPMSTDNVFWIASMTKPVTAVAIMMLVEEGKISLDDAASKFVPELGAMKNKDGSSPKTITVKTPPHPHGRLAREHA